MNKKSLSEIELFTKFAEATKDVGTMNRLSRVEVFEPDGKRQIFRFDDNGLMEEWDNDEMIAYFFDKAATCSIANLVKGTSEARDGLMIELVESMGEEGNINADFLECLPSVVWDKESHEDWLEMELELMKCRREVA